MRWIASLLLLLALAAGVRAAGTDDQYLDIYSQLLQADSLLQGGHQDAAAVKYRDALIALQKMHDEHPSWNPAVMSFRLADLADKVKSLAQYPPSTNAVPVPAPAPVAGAATASPPDQFAALQQQIQELNAANNELRMKLKEALSVQPAAAAPAELAKAREKILLLQKERDLLAVTVEQLKTSATESAKAAGELAALKTSFAQESKLAQKKIADLQSQLDETRKKLAAATAELTALKAAPPVSENVKQLAAERDRLKKELATVSKNLANLEAHPAAASGKTGDQDSNLKLAAVEQQRDNLTKQLAALTNSAVSSSQTAPAGSTAEADGLRARLAVLEAAAVPYTPEELAVVKAAPNPPLPAPAVVSAPPQRAVHSMKDLPPGAGALMADAQRAALEHDYASAEKKYQEVLSQAPDNVFVLVNLGNAEFDLGHFDDCEKNAQRAIALDPQDPMALYLLGVLRYRQEKMDESLDALSRSAAINPTNANTQYGLGRVLADKGMQSAAETAFRKALVMDPDRADTHYGLALAYAMEKPPSLALARYHYQKSVDLGHVKNSNLEKLLAGGQ